MKTLNPKQLSATERKWYVVDAKGKNLGRLSTEIAQILRGKKKVDFAPHVDNGDYVIVINCDKFNVTGAKMSQKMYYRHTGFLGGLKSISLEDLLEKKPSQALQFAVSGMLPKNKLRKEMLSRLKLFRENEHTYSAQQPETITL